MTEKIAKALRSIDLLADLPASFLLQLEQFSMIRQIHAGETIFCQGEPSPYCFGIVFGQVSIQRVPREKNLPSKILSVLGRGSLFGEQALFKDTPRAAMAVASQDGELVAIQGRQFREWLEKDKTAGLPLLMGMFQNTLFRLHQTSHELSLVYGVGRMLASEKPIQTRIGETLHFLRASLENIDEIIVYKRSLYWEEFEPLVDKAAASSEPPPVLPIKNPLVQELIQASAPLITKPEDKGKGVALVPFYDPDDSKRDLKGFLWVASHKGPSVFSPNILMLLSTLSVQFTEALHRQNRLEEQSAQSRLNQSRQSFNP